MVVDLIDLEAQNPLMVVGLRFFFFFGTSKPSSKLLLLLFLLPMIPNLASVKVVGSLHGRLRYGFVKDDFDIPNPKDVATKSSQNVMHLTQS